MNQSIEDLLRVLDIHDTPGNELADEVFEWHATVLDALTAFIQSRLKDPGVIIGGEARLKTPRPHCTSLLDRQLVAVTDSLVEDVFRLGTSENTPWMTDVLVRMHDSITEILGASPLGEQLDFSTAEAGCSFPDGGS